MLILLLAVKNVLITMIYKRFFLILLSFSAVLSYADIGVSPMIVDLIGADADAEIAVKNSDTQHNAYVAVTAYRLSDPANHLAAKKRVSHPEKDGLLVFPAKLVLLPGQTQFVRVVATQKNSTIDRVYEVDVVPTVSTRLISSERADKVKLGIRVIVGYGARVTVRPDHAKPELLVKQSQQQLTIQNTGNTSLAITSCTQLIKGHKNQIPLPAYTIYAGQTIKKTLTQPGQVTLDAVFMGKPIGPFYTH